MSLFKKEKPLEYKDIEASIRFMMASEEEVAKIIKVFADAAEAFNKVVEPSGKITK